jgi:hypothetical protein
MPRGNVGESDFDSEPEADSLPFGFVDGADEQGASGWARPSKNAFIRIVVNGSVAARMPARAMRPDLRQIGLQNVNCGFAFQWDASWVRSCELLVELQNDAGTLLVDGGLVFSLGRVESGGSVQSHGDMRPSSSAYWKFVASIRPNDWFSLVGRTLQRRWSGLDDEGFIWIAYKVLLERAPDAHGLDSSLKMIRSSSAGNRADFLEKIMTSDEYQQRRQGVPLEWFIRDPYNIGGDRRG